MAFLTDEQEQTVVRAIAQAEKQTSGEIRIHMEEHAPREPLERAARLFHELGMDQTEEQNGILIYVATEDHKVAVYAGKGVHRQVEDHFWNDVLQLILEHFREERHAEGLIAAVEKSAAKLAGMYPYARGDVNELTNKISYRERQKPENE
ncbi:MAG: TPM domain-containing protein [Balneolaceae bacterium]|nr:TPM domain-containing protein [Balneolaceae bacterium]